MGVLNFCLYVYMFCMCLEDFISITIRLLFFSFKLFILPMYIFYSFIFNVYLFTIHFFFFFFVYISTIKQICPDTGSVLQGNSGHIYSAKKYVLFCFYEVCLFLGVLFCCNFFFWHCENFSILQKCIVICTKNLDPNGLPYSRNV